MRDLLDDCKRFNVSDETIKVLANLACCPSDLRLALNLKIFAGLSVLRKVDDILVYGLTIRERDVLMELDGKQLPIRSREVAHGLMNIHERYIVMRSLSKALHEAKEARSEHLGDKTIVDLLGESNG